MPTSKLSTTKIQDTIKLLQSKFEVGHKSTSNKASLKEIQFGLKNCSYESTSSISSSDETSPKNQDLMLLNYTPKIEPSQQRSKMRKESIQINKRIIESSIQRRRRSVQQVKQFNVEEMKRVGKQIPKLQNNDSHTLFDEEYDQIFNDPHRRKNFDIDVLSKQNQSMLAMGDVILASEDLEACPLVFVETDHNHDGGPLKYKNFATLSLCGMSQSNPFRAKIIRVVLNRWFERTILVVILANCAYLAVEGDIEIEANNEIELAFLLVYILEILLKVIAMGFVMQKHSFLRDWWNCLDFLVVLTSIVGIFLSESNVSAIRIIRILRALRTITALPGMSSLVTTIVISLPSLFDIMIMFVFTLVSFGTISTQLFMGHFQRRCQLVTAEQMQAPEITANRSELLLVNDSEVFCQSHEFCESVAGGALVQCVVHGNPNRGTFNFDNVLFSMFNIFQVITEEGWTDMMYLTRKAEGTKAYDALFLAEIIIGAYFVLNLMVAVQFKHLLTAFEDQSVTTDEPEELPVEELKAVEPEIVDPTFLEEESQGSISNSSVSIYQSETEIEPAVMDLLREKLKTIVDHPVFLKILILIIVLNSIMLACEFYNQPDWLTTTSRIANYVFTSIFTIEVLLRLGALGFKEYFSDGFNIFDSIIVVTSIVEFLLPGESTGISVFRSFRLMRIFKIIKTQRSLRVLLKKVDKSLASIANLGVLTLIIIFIYCLLAKQFYSQTLLDADGNESRYSFQSTTKSMITTFIVLTAENWNEIMIQVIEATQSYVPALFFMSQIIFGTYMLLNLFLAVLLKFIIQQNLNIDSPQEAQDPTQSQTLDQTQEQQPPPIEQ